MAKGNSHIHKLKRHKYRTGNAVYFCTLESCHYKIEVPLALGKRSLCNICDKEFIINEYTLKLAKPHCSDCGKVKVMDNDGRPRYVKKANNRILTTIAANSTNDLRSRLEAATGVVEDKDI